MIVTSSVHIRMCPRNLWQTYFTFHPKKNENVLKDSGTLLLKHVNRSIKKQLSSSLMDFKSSSKYVEFGGKYFKYEQCNFVANRLVSFAPCLSAWRAVPHQNMGDTPRETIQSFIGYSQKLPLNHAHKNNICEALLKRGWRASYVEQKKAIVKEIKI